MGDANGQAGNELQFITCTHPKPPSGATRLLIRKHVMRGKKKRKTAQRQQPMPGRAEKVDIQDVIRLFPPSGVPCRVGSDVSCIGVDEIAESTLTSITRVSPLAARIIYPLRTATTVQTHSPEWLYNVTRDRGLLYITAFAIESFIDRVLRGDSSTKSLTATMHYHRGVRLLHEQTRAGSAVTDLTIAAVVKLAGAALFDGDELSARKHMESLSGMIDVRGGIGELNEDVRVDILRCDLGLAVTTFSKRSYFYNNEDLIPPYPEELLRSLPDSSWRQTIDDLLLNIDCMLKEVCLVLKRFCMLANLSGETGRHMHPSTIHQTMMATMYRLAQMAFPVDSTDETVRQGLLLYATHLFLQWQDVKMVLEQASSRYRAQLTGPCSVALPSQMVLWLAAVGALSVFDSFQEPWLRKVMRGVLEECNIKTWSSLRTTLKSFLWVDILDETAGKAIFATMREK